MTTPEKKHSSRAQYADMELGKKPVTQAVIPEAQKPSAALVFILVSFVVCGTFSTVLSKILFQSSSVGSDGDMHPFQKPLFQNTGMFAGMSLCLLIFGIQSRVANVNARISEQQPLLSANGVEVPHNPYRVYYVVLVPALCDFLATYMMNIGLLWINASVWQMVRGSIVFFVAVIRYFALGKKIQNFQWFGILVVMSALAIIGFSCVMSSGEVTVASTEDIVVQESVSPLMKIGGVALVFGAQMVQATQCVMEEFLMHDLGATDMQVVGLEGIWGLVLCVAVAMPFAAYTSMHGLHEDTWDTLTMLKNSVPLQLLFTVYVLVILAYNMLAMKVTRYLDSVRRNVLDTLRTMFIWATLTIVHYTYSPAYGEEWTTWSYLQLAGFAVLIFGLFTYYEVIVWPSIFDYPKLEVVHTSHGVKPINQTLTPSLHKKKPLPGSHPASPYIPGSPRI